MTPRPFTVQWASMGASRLPLRSRSQQSRAPASDVKPTVTTTRASGPAAPAAGHGRPVPREGRSQAGSRPGPSTAPAVRGRLHHPGGPPGPARSGRPGHTPPQPGSLRPLPTAGRPASSTGPARARPPPVPGPGRSRAGIRSAPAPRRRGRLRRHDPRPWPRPTRQGGDPTPNSLHVSRVVDASWPARLIAVHHQRHRSGVSRTIGRPVPGRARSTPTARACSTWAICARGVDPTARKRVDAAPAAEDVDRSGWPMMLGKAGSTRRCSTILAIGCNQLEPLWLERSARAGASTGSALPLPVDVRRRKAARARRAGSAIEIAGDHWPL
jgi:hypothetical protein